jgi:hypothetical protein
MVRRKKKKDISKFDVIETVSKKRFTLLLYGREEAEAYIYPTKYE